jgi:hypothetical protein
MKKLLLINVGLLFLSGLASAQVIEGFNTAGSLGKYVDTKNGTLVDSIFQTASPTNANNGVMGVALDLKGAVDKDQIGWSSTYKGHENSGTAQLLTMWVYIPATSTIPDSVDFQQYYQPVSGGAWTWTSYDNYALNIPKGKWFPLSVPIRELAIFDPKGHGLTGTNDIGDFGVQFINAGNSSSQVWKGVVYVDSVCFVGTDPRLITDPMAVQWSNGHTTSITRVAGPIGGLSNVWADSISGDTTSAAGYGDQPAGAGIAAHIEHFLVTWVYVDTTFPDTGFIQTWAQSDPSWNWPSPVGPVIYKGSSIPRDVWYPLYFDMVQASDFDTASGSFYNTMASTDNLRKLGIQIGGTNWTGVVYMTNVSLIHDTVYVAPPPTGIVSVIANFENPGSGPNAGLQGFNVPSYAYGTLARAQDISSGDATYLLQGAADFSKSPHEFAAVVNNVILQDTVNTNNIPSKLAFSIYLPSTMPLHAAVEFFVSGGKNDSLSVIDTVNNNMLKVGQWDTLQITKMDTAAFQGKFDPTKSATIGVVVYYPAPYDTTSWAGTIDFDNLVVYGIARGELVDGVKKSGSLIPTVYQLYSNYPNPFNPSTMIKYDLPKDSKVVLKLYDVVGREVATLVNGKQTAGSYEVQFNASNLASGVYFFRITAGDYIKTQKMVLLK